MVLSIDLSENSRLSEPFGACINQCDGLRPVLRPVCL